MSLMNRDELLTEIERVSTILKNSSNRKVKHDYGKHLKRLYGQLRYYDRNYKK